MCLEKAISSYESQPLFLFEKSKYLVLGFIEKAFPGRTVSQNFGKYHSVILLGRCTFRCEYCDVSGYQSSPDHTMPNAWYCDRSEIYKFIDSQVQKGTPIVISGGEPTLFPEIVEDIAGRIIEIGGYAVMCTHGGNAKLSDRLGKHVHEVGISIKGSIETVQKMTGRPIKESWYNPIASVKKISSRGIPVEVTLMVYNFSKASDYFEVLDECNSFCFPIVKGYKAKTIAIQQLAYSTHYSSSHNWFWPPTEALQFAIFDELIDRYPHLAMNFRIAMGGDGTNVIVTNSGTHEFRME